MDQRLKGPDQQASTTAIHLTTATITVAYGSWEGGPTPLDRCSDAIGRQPVGMISSCWKTFTLSSSPSSSTMSPFCTVSAVLPVTVVTRRRGRRVRVPFPSGTDGRNAVANRGGGPSVGRLHGPIASREEVAMSARQEGRRAARLGARTLLEKQELAPRVIHVRLVEVDDHLEWEHQFAVQVAVQRVPVLLAVAEQDRGRLGLAGLVAHVQPLVQGVRPGGGSSEFGPPVTRDGQEPRIEGLLQLLDRFLDTEC